MKYFVLLCDGLSDEPIAELGGKTIMEYAKTPNIDVLAKGGRSGFVHTTPTGYAPGSDICNLSAFGYDPRKCYTGRSPLEAASIGIDLGPKDMAFRCNLVQLSDDGKTMIDFSAGHIGNNTAGKIVKRLQEIFKDSGIEFHQGVGYRHLMITRNKTADVKLTPPHDITGKEVTNYLPSGIDSDFINSIIEKAKIAFSEDSGLANSIWLWGQGKKPSIRPYYELYGKKGAVISAVDLIKGIGICAGMDIINVPGATGFIDTNYKGKAEYGINDLEDHDYVFVHLESPDESGHMGSIENKLKSFEDIDSIMVPIIMNGLKKYGEYRILIMPDHPTPVKLRTHTSDPVPALLYGSGIDADENQRYSENIKPSFILKDGYKIAEMLFN